jgi:predicted  nucleic acid-binding Zn-ribbon protein
VLSNQQLLKIVRTLSSHHSKDVHYINKIMASMASYPWHCSCGRLNGKRHTHCPACKGHWSAGTPHSNEPKSPRVQQGHSDHNTGWEWTSGGQNSSKKNKKNQRWRSESARRSGKGKGKGYKGQEIMPLPFAQSVPPAIPPWPSPETSSTSHQQTPVAPAASLAHHAELLMAVRKHYPDLSQAPEDIQKAVDKSEKATTKVLTTDLNKASKQVGKAARQLSTVKDARALHRQNWLKHLRDSVASWQKQLQLFKDQQKEYGDQLAKAQQELNSARRHLQHLNKQAAEIGAPTSTETGETTTHPADMDNCPNFEAEAHALAQQVQESLQQSIAAAAAEREAVDLMSEEDEEADRKNKRPRSMEPFGGGQQPGFGGPTSSPKQ